MERVKAATGMGGERGGTLPRLDTEEGWEHKEAGYGGRGTEGRAYCSGYEGQEFQETQGVPAGSGRERYPRSFSGFWEDWKVGLAYNNTEWETSVLSGTSPFYIIHDTRDPLLWRAVLAEGSATAAFTFFLLSTWVSIQEGDLTETGILRVALSAGLSYGVLNWIFHSVSGGHMNPAVTLATMLNSRITLLRALCYWGAQIVGAIAGAAMARAMNPGSFRAVSGGVNRLNVGWRAALLGEIMGTLLVVFAFLVAYDRRRRYSSDHVNVLAPLEIGLAVTAAHLFLVPFTWCSINPARSIGAAIIGGRWTHHWIWWVAPIIAGVVGPLLYETFFKHFYTAVPSEEEVKAQQWSRGQAQAQTHGGQRPQQIYTQQQPQESFGQQQRPPGIVSEQERERGVATY